MKPLLLLLATVLLWTGPAVGIEILPPNLRGATQPQIVIATNNAVHVTCGRTGVVYCVTSRDGGKTFEPPVEVGSLAKLALGRHRGPRMAVHGQNLVISAISHADGNLVSWRSSDGGKTWAPPVTVNSVDGAAREGLHAMAAGPDSVHVAWLDLRSGKTELWLASSTNAGRIWSGNQRVYQSPGGTICECCHPSLAVDSKGQLWAMWRNSLEGARDMYISERPRDAVAFLPARKLGTGNWLLKACPMDGGDLAFDSRGRLLTIWRRDRMILVAGETGERILAAHGSHPVVTVAGGQVHYLWQSGTKLMWQRGTAAPETLDQGAFASVDSTSSEGIAMAAWESTTNGLKTIEVRRLE